MPSLSAASLGTGVTPPGQTAHPSSLSILPSEAVIGHPTRLLCGLPRLLSTLPHTGAAYDPPRTGRAEAMEGPLPIHLAVSHTHPCLREQLAGPQDPAPVGAVVEGGKRSRTPTKERSQDESNEPALPPTCTRTSLLHAESQLLRCSRHQRLTWVTTTPALILHSSYCKFLPPVLSTVKLTATDKEERKDI